MRGNLNLKKMLLKELLSCKKEEARKRNTPKSSIEIVGTR